MSSDGTDVWVTNATDGTVSEIDAASGTVVNTIPVGNAPLGVSSDGTHVWVANEESGTVSEIQISATALIAQAITGVSLPTAPVVGGSYTVTATGGGSGLPVMFSIDSSSAANACTSSGTNGATIKFTGGGKCVIDAGQAGTATYSAAPQVQQSFTIAAALIAQAITNVSLPTSPTVGGSYTVTATGGGSGLPVTFSIDSSSAAGACTSSGTNGATIKFTGAGKCVIDAKQAGNTAYSVAPQVTQSFTIAAAVTVTPAGIGALTAQYIQDNPYSLGRSASVLAWRASYYGWWATGLLTNAVVYPAVHTLEIAWYDWSVAYLARYEFITPAQAATLIAAASELP